MVGMVRRGRRTGGGGSPSPDAECEALELQHRQLVEEIEQLEGFICDAPEIRRERLEETKVTLPPLDGAAGVGEWASGAAAGAGDESARLARRHMAARRRARRKNFLVFVVVAVLVSGFLRWVSLVVS